MKLAEEERLRLLSKYDNKVSEDLLIHLKRTFHVYLIENDSFRSKLINIYGKSHILTNNKKFLVNKLTSIVEDDWNHLDVPTIRRTIKKFLDGNLINSN